MVVEARGGARAEPGEWRRDSSSRKLRERIVKVLLASCAYVSVLTTFGIVLVLLFETIGFFREVSIVEFLTTTRWAPSSPSDPSFGVLSLIYGTLITTVIAIAVALPIGLLAAIYLAEYASRGLRRWLKPALEVLAGVPTVVYGFFALTLVTPFLRSNVFADIGAFNVLAAGLVMGIMIIPTVASVSEDAIYAVPMSLREGAYALGATKRETATRVVLPAALSGIVAATILGVSRAIGETMIVAVAAGTQARFPESVLGLPGSIFEGFLTMTAYIVNVVGGETTRGSVTYQSIFAVGATLFVMTLLLNLVSYWIVRRYREVY